MEIKKQTIVSLSGRLDTTTAPKLEEELRSILPGCKDLVFDFEDLEYVSSAGLRIILSTFKTMKNKGTFQLINVKDDIKSLFKITGFANFLDIK